MVGSVPSVDAVALAGAPPAVAVTDDATLMLRYRDGDARAFEILYERHKGPLYRYLQRMCGRREVADDLFQEVWSKVIASRSRYEARAQFNTFLFRIAKEPVTLGGHAIAAGDVVFVSNHCVNRDAAVYEEPDRFRPRRAKNPHMAYGHGSHYCLGAKLAREAMVACFRRLAERFPRLTMDERAVARKHPSLAFSGFERLAVRRDSAVRIVVAPISCAKS